MAAVPNYIDPLTLLYKSTDQFLKPKPKVQFESSG
ncbi:hypothetical protein CCACVL1_04703 [Corchorus capsularis]|uniref:Uncharacterized protein n=1 Tax=Corchorus capsularis TaxID=210143 RepID=A0A1R3JQ96_COCAP|nr:hypothetical protein CCACVL1_04703 [Corchorus capsularis]